MASPSCPAELGWLGWQEGLWLQEDAAGGILCLVHQLVTPWEGPAAACSGVCLPEPLCLKDDTLPQLGLSANIEES